MKPSKPPFYKQETPDSCVPACLRMILATFGLDMAEAQLRALCDCTFLGTDALKVVDAARQLGFPGTAKHNLRIEELAATLSKGLLPIVYVDIQPIDGVYQPHALVITEINQFSVHVIDPDKGERLIPRDLFIAAWKMRHQLAIIIER